MSKPPSAILPALLSLALFLPHLTSTAHATPPATWTTGHKKVLIIPVRFTDQTGPSDVPSSGGILSGWGNIANGTMTTAMSNFMAQQSYGQCTLEFTVLPEINLGVSYTVYNAPLNADSLSSKFTRWYEPGSLASDVRNKARQVGLGTGTPALYDTDNYDLDIIATGFIPGQGNYATAVTYGKGIYANLFSALPHELCHNLGLSHAQGISRSTFYAPLVRNTFFDNKYGNVFDLMGYKETHVQPLPADRDAGTYWKYKLGWLTEPFITTPVTSGTYRVHAFDQGTLDAGKSYALRIARDPTHTYWFDYRQAITGADSVWSQNGLQVQIGAESYESSAGNTLMLDMTPGSRGLAGAVFATMHDAPLAIGRTFTDPEANLHVTPIQKGGTTPESLDVVVNFGPFPGNGAPTVSIAPGPLSLAVGVSQVFTATASDPDADPLSYYWEFEDSAKPGGMESGGSNPDSRLATQGTHSWNRNGVYYVRCTVSDMKGHQTTASVAVTITGGSAGLLTISGMVKDENGNPLAGAIVNNFSVTNGVSYDSANFAASGETAADGKYMVRLPAIGAHTYKLAVLHQGYAFSCSVGGGAISVNASNVANVNFTRIRTNRTISGSIAVAGRGYDPVADGPLTVSTGAQSTLASTGFWQMTVADNTLVNLTATPSNPAYSVFSSFSNPHLVVADYDVFYFAVKIPGKMPETGFTTGGTTTDDNAGTVNIPVTMTLPAGYNSWPSQQDFDYWIDPSSTAEYGVDYKMSGGRLTFYGGVVPVPRMIPLQIIHDGMPKDKTVVIKMGVSSGIANLGPITTFTYRITNPFRINTLTQTGNQLNLTWDSTAAAQYTIETSPSLSPATWSSVAPHIDLPGAAGSMTRSVTIGGNPKQFYRVKAAW